MISSLFNRNKAPDDDRAQALGLPAETQGRFTFCNSTKPSKVKDWFDQLPITNYQLVASKLYLALPELYSTKLSNSARADIIEHIRPLVLNCVAAITAPLAKKPLTISDSEKKTALVAQALLKHLALVYSRLAINALADKKITAVTNAVYFHRALTVLSLLIKNNYRLYTPVPNQVWRLTNGIYRLARSKEMHNVNIPDAFDSHYSGSCNHRYLASLALTCARPLQLQPKEIEHLYTEINGWVHQLFIEDYSAERQTLFAVLSDADQEPDYADTFEQSELEASGLQFDFRVLLDKLAKFNGKINTGSTPIPPSLITHLAYNWGTRVRRVNPRIDCQAELEVCIGLSTIHNLLTKGANFEEFVFGTPQSSGLAMRTDWANTSSDKEPDAKPPTSNDIYSMLINNSGKNGFQLQCQDKIPKKLQAGEIMAFRESGKRNWQLAAVRWVKRGEKLGVQFGVMFIGRRLEAYSASTETDSGRDSDFLRVLLVNESLPDGSPSLITPNAVFNEELTVTLKKRGESTRIKISQPLTSGGSYCQYRYRSI